MWIALGIIMWLVFVTGILCFFSEMAKREERMRKLFEEGKRRREERDLDERIDSQGGAFNVD